MNANITNNNNNNNNKLSINKTKILMVGPHKRDGIPTGGDAALFELTIDLLQTYPDIHVVSVSTSRPRSNFIHRLFSSIKTLVQILFYIRTCNVIVVFLTNVSLPVILRILLPIKLLFGKPLIVKKFGGRAHNDDWRIIYPPTPFPEKISNKITKLLKQVDLYLPETKHAFDAAQKEGISSIWFPNYRNLSTSKQADCSVNHQVFRCVFIGRVVPEKGINEIIQADKFYNDNIQIDVFGPFDKRLSKHDFQFLKHVKYYNTLNHSEVPDILSQYQAFVFPSFYPNEGHPGSLIEAMAAGLPIITTDRPFIYEVVTKNEAVIVQAQDAKQLADAVNLLAENESLRKQLSENALQRSKMFDAETLIPVLVDCCRKLVQKEHIPEQYFDPEYLQKTFT
ncbi:MAG: glycosyltransferase family 4 protein [Bacteroidales bacterium]|nr:glycosyltransferase family 4 protein [Bacteroidales bacterium]